MTPSLALADRLNAWGLIGLIALIVTYYLIAPSAEHIVKLVRLASLPRRR
jgi:hypothetical protein